MKVKYTEGPTSLVIDGVGRVERGETVEVSKECGEQLAAQGWSVVGKKSTSTKRKKSTSTKSTPPASPATNAAPEAGKEGDE